MKAINAFQVQKIDKRSGAGRCHGLSEAGDRRGKILLRFAAKAHHRQMIVLSDALIKLVCVRREGFSLVEVRLDLGPALQCTNSTNAYRLSRILGI